MAQEHEGRPGSGFRAFWKSLPGVLTGAAALIGAIATLGALFVGADEDDATTARPPAAGQARMAASGDDEACFGRYFAGIPRDRVASVEVGTENLDVIGPSQPKRGTVGLRLTSDERAIGALRFAYLPANALFRIESVVDADCRRVEDYVNAARGGDKDTLQDSDTVRLPLAGGFYDLRTIGGTTIRVQFHRYVP